MSYLYRLASNPLERPEEENRIPPSKVFFLSVEGSRTEKDYFRGVEKFRTEIGIHTLVHVEILNRHSKDGKSDPQQVLELLEEYIQLREGELIPDDILEKLFDKYGREDIEKYINNSTHIPKNKRKEIDNDLLMTGIDLAYRKYLKDYNGYDDCFGIFIDRDFKTHSVELMQRVVDRCKELNSYCFIANPYFEFWLLLHVCDVKTEYKEYLDKAENGCVPEPISFFQDELNKREHQGKKISLGKFRNTYMPNIDNAIQNAEKFEVEGNDFINNIGSNLPELFKVLRKMDS